MALRTRKAFTLVELLVVIAIIAILVGLTVPAVLMARSAARRSQCGHRQRELGLAIAEYELAKNRLPGYVNSMGVGDPPPDVPPLANNLSWAVVLLPYLEQNDMWAEFREGKLSRDPANQWPTTQAPDIFPRLLPTFLCPADDLNKAVYPLSYIANAGMFKPDLSIDLALFVNRDRGQVAGTLDQVQSERMKDGAEYTIMLSENMQATQWLTTAGTTVRRTFVADVGLLWPQNIANSPSSMPSIDSDAPLAAPGPQANFGFARPSSDHPGGVMATFGDGHQTFLDEGIDPGVYLKMVCPDDAKAGL